jgi:acetyl-CoA acetyltransferase
MKHACIVDAVRTPFGRYGGAKAAHDEKELGKALDEVDDQGPVGLS